MKEYICSSCKTEWEFIPKDYGYQKKYYPTKCPLCSMPITQMIRDTYQNGGIKEVLFWLWKRIIK
jgi:DNA-directed RNA polymerase subunit RPC12/RpoP